jgi:hypothetical protein
MRKEKEVDKSSKENKQYERPRIVTYTEDEILDLIGPANTAGSPCFIHIHGFGNRNGRGHGRH